MRKISMAAVAAFWAVMLGAAAPAPADDPESTVVEELVVQALERGPAWWRVSDGDTVVYILGLPPARRPKDVTWDSAVLERRLAGAHTIILPSGAKATVRDIGAALKLRRSLRTDETLEETLPPQLRDRFVRARQAVNQPAKRYAQWKPIVAGELLLEDTMKARGLTSYRFEARFRQKPAPTKIARLYPGMPVLQTALAGLTKATSLACLENALESVEVPLDVYRKAYEGWARGDVATALTAPRGFEVCMLQLNGGVTFWRRATNDAVMDISMALAKPGHAVALVGLRQLVAEGGVIEGLKARGLQVRGPGDPG